MKNPLLILLLVMSQILPAQEKLEDAKQSLKELKNSFLLVRLRTNAMAIDALEERGRKEEAERLREQQYRENLETILSFQKTFQFCPVYFFYSNKSGAIREGKLEGNVFDADLNVVDASEHLTARPFFTAEFSETDDLGISALIIMDQDMVPLEAPFPYFERKYVFFSLISLSKARMAEKLNERLFSHWERWDGG